VDFHPSGNKMATCSGDTTIKIWDFSQKKCIHTFTNHLLPGKRFKDLKINKNILFRSLVG
jgi:WD40 repeat protein